MSAPTPSATPSPAPISTQRNWSEIAGKGIKVLLQEMAIALVMDFLFDRLLRNAAGRVGDHLGIRAAKILEESRACFEGDLLKMPRDHTNKIREWHQNVLKNNHGDDNHFVALVCKLTSAKDGTPLPETERQLLLEKLNELTEEEFNQALCILDHDVIQKAWENLLREGKIVGIKTMEGFEKAASKTVHAMALGAALFDDAVGTTLPIIRQFADQLEAPNGRSAFGNLLLRARQQLDKNAATKGGRL
jgi:hypothetical protein